jgi:enamine deaminase RidA (YjgF/YER057c/UK114 family)
MEQDGKLRNGRVGENVSIEDARDAARLTALNILASLKHAVGDLDKVRNVPLCFSSMTVLIINCVLR